MFKRHCSSYALGFAILLAGVAAGEENHASPAADPATMRTTRSGDVVGFVGTANSDAWLGVPYARPPVGEWRWRAPRAAQSWKGTRQSVTAASACPQPTAAGVTGDEDCLYLNIWSPRRTTADIGSRSKRLPVMFWIHGGGNVTGTASTYDGGILATTQQVVVVTINYRLGMLGWFRQASLRGGGATAQERSGNYGTLDQVLALRWVRDNIAAFGGDPNLVTIFGESAGGWNVFSLLAVPQATGLFHRAIVQSGGDMTASTAASENYSDDREAGMAKSSGEALLRLLVNEGKAADRNAAKAVLAAMKPAALATYLRSRSFADLNRAYQQITDAQGQAGIAVGFPQLFRDGVVLPANSIRERFSSADYRPVPLIVGSTKDEYTIFINTPAFVEHGAAGIKVKDKPRYYLAAEYLSRLWRADSVAAVAQVVSRVQPKVFTYRFDWGDVAAAPWLDNMLIGATHGTDVPFVFGQAKLGPEFFQVPLYKPQGEAARRELSLAMMSYWTQFALTGDPGRGRHNDLPLWSAWKGSGDASRALLLDSPANGGLRMSDTDFSRASVLADLEADPRLGSSARRCEFFSDLQPVAAGSHFIDADYQTLVGPRDLREFLGGNCIPAAASK